MPIPQLNGAVTLPQLAGSTKAVFQVTGMASPNQTHHVNVIGTDLGIMWDDGRGRMLTAFGDTAGLGIRALAKGELWDWGSNMLFRSRPGDPAQGIHYESFVPNPVPSPKIAHIEVSRIPTAGISVGGIQYLNLMSVLNWDAPGKWTTNFSCFAESRDDGQTWTELTETRRANTDGFQKFQMNALLKDRGYVYRYGTPAGRDNPGFVSRVPQDRITAIPDYEYWDGGSWVKGRATAAKPIVEHVAELSVLWNQQLHKFVMLTTDPATSVVLRTADAPQGPWSPPRVIVDARELPTAYAPMAYPYQTGRDLYFLLSVHSQYNVLLMRAPLRL